MSPEAGVPRGRVTVTGVGTASAAPDSVRLRLRATALRPTAAAALAAADECVVRTRAALAGHSVPATSADLGLSAEEGWAPDPATGANVRSRHGFRATHALSSVVPLATVDLGDLLAAVLDAGGEDLALDGVEFLVADDAPLLTSARTRAWDDATTRATEHAAAAGGRLGRVLDVTEGGGGPGRPMPKMAVAASFSVEPGAVDTSVAVTVGWELF